MTRRDWIGSLGLLALILAPRLYLWGTAPAGVHGDEGGYAALGARVFAHPIALWGFAPNALPWAGCWVLGLARHLLGGSIWSARLVTSIFGVLQALAAVSIAWRIAGLSGAVTTALVMAMPLEIHYERVVLPSVWTTATWTVALWCVVREPRSSVMAFVAGVVLALGWYGYQSSRVGLPIAAVGLAAAFATGRLRGGPVLAGVIGFALGVAPIVYGFTVAPAMLLGRAHATSWLSGPWTWEQLSGHLQATAALLVGRGYDTTSFFPIQLPLVPVGIAALGAVGLLSAPAPLGWCLGAWIVFVAAGHVMRDVPAYSPVLVCLVPALAIAAGCAARAIRGPVPRVGMVVLPALVAMAVPPALAVYFRTATVLPRSEVLPMGQAAFVDALPDGRPVYIAGGAIGCSHGLTQMALRERQCVDIIELPEDADHAVVVLYPEFQSLADACTRAHLQVHSRDWAGLPVEVCAPPGVAVP